MSTNPGPIKRRGGARANAGRKSLSQIELRRLAAVEGKSRDELLAEVDEGYIKALRTVASVMPDIIASLTEKALKGNVPLQKFLVMIYFRYIGSAPRHVNPAPVVNLHQSLRLVLEEAERRGTIAPRVVEGEIKETAFGIINKGLAKDNGYQDPADSAESYPNGHHPGHQPD